MSQPPDYSAVIQTMPWAFGAVTVMFIYMRWERIHRQDQEYQKELRSEERGREMAKEEKERLVRSANLDKQVKTEQFQQDIGGGYIVLEMSEEKKALFHDVLKGFEDYAKLKGYEIRFCVDTGQPEKIAFKFTIMGSGITVSTQQVSRDLQEYIRKVENGDLLDDIPILLPFGQ